MWFREGIRLELSIGSEGPPEELDADALAELDDLEVVEDPERVARARRGGRDRGRGRDPIVASAMEVLREKSFADLSEEERHRVALLIRRLAITMPVRHTRRYRPAASGARFAAHAPPSLRTQGEPFHRAWRARRSRARPLVLILDISGSMAPYSRALAQFAFAAMAAGRRVEVFCFGTRLTRSRERSARRTPTARCTRSAGSSRTGRAGPGSARR